MPPPDRAAAGHSGHLAEYKAQLRRHFRSLRRNLDDVEQRSAAIWRSLTELPEYRDSVSVMMFDSIRGEPETVQWKLDAIESGRNVYVPEDETIPGHIDVAVVPGLAFTPAGGRLGQGGGWYDRFLTQTSIGVTVGVCFEAQLVDNLPVEAHDVFMALVVTERGIRGGIHTSR